MSEMPEYVLKDIAKKAVGELVAALEQKARELDVAYAEVERYANLYAKSQAEARELDAANEEIKRLKARNEFLEKVADQLADGVQVVTITKENQHQYSRGYRYVGEDAVVTEGVATCGVDCMPEAAAYLRERETKEGSV